MNIIPRKPIDIEKMINQTRDTFTIYIEWANGDFKKIEQVTDYGILPNNKVFYYVKNDVKSFIPIEHVLYFGNDDDWSPENTDHTSDVSLNDICLGDWWSTTRK